MSLITSDIVPSEDLIQLLTEDGGRGGPLGGSDEGDFRTYLAGNNFRIILSEIDPDFNNNGRVGSGNSGGLLAGTSYLGPRPIECKLDHTQT